MTTQELKERIPEDEFIFTASRSSGPGGQNVNKVNTRVELRFNVLSSVGLSDQEKEMICLKLKRRINSAGELVVRSQAARTQLRNKTAAEEKILKILCEALTEKPERKPTLPTAKSQIKRLEEKHKRSIIKNLRKDSTD